MGKSSDSHGGEYEDGCLLDCCSLLEAESTSETSVNYNQTTRPEDSHLQENKRLYDTECSSIIYTLFNLLRNFQLLRTPEVFKNYHKSHYRTTILNHISPVHIFTISILILFSDSFPDLSRDYLCWYSQEISGSIFYIRYVCSNTWPSRLSLFQYPTHMR
jgi:hypothetical protein